MGLRNATSRVSTVDDNSTGNLVATDIRYIRNVTVERENKRNDPRGKSIECISIGERSSSKGKSFLNGTSHSEHRDGDNVASAFAILIAVSLLIRARREVRDQGSAWIETYLPGSAEA